MSLWNIIETIFIAPLKLAFEYIFYFAHAVVGNPGLAIVALSLAMNVLVLPLYRRADMMQEAARDVENKLSRGVNHIKKSFSGDERMMILQTYYRQNHYKPTDALKGSVSLLLEVPFFMAAYQFLSTLNILENSSFGPIKDLGVPDGLIVIGGLTINALPVLMTLINVISSAIYLKGFPLKTKIQLYGMALFFLVFLYHSPAGLVFYWTLNNLFSLCKTIFYRLKNPRRVAMGMLLAAGSLISIYGLFFYDAVTLKRKVFVLAVGFAALNQFHQAGGGDPHHIGGVELFHQPLKLLFPEGDLGSHNADVAGRKPAEGRLQRRLNAQNDNIGIGLPQDVDGGGGGGIAGHYQCLCSSI